MANAARFVVRLNQVSDTNTTVNYATEDMSATAGVDYTAASGVLTVPAGQVSGNVDVFYTPPAEDEPTEKKFRLRLSGASGGSIGDTTAEVVLNPGTLPFLPYIDTGEKWKDRFDWAYRTFKSPTYGYFGPTSGPNAYKMPYHSVETLIAEAPDWGHESASETVSFWGRTEAWRLALFGEKTGFEAAWASVENIYVPSNTNQPLGTYNASHPADYVPDGDYPTDYPRVSQPEASVGADPFYSLFLSTYGTKRMYLMHWFFDVDGIWGYHNGDGTTTCVAINNYNRGPHEGLFKTITHNSWEDWTQQAAGGNAYGFLPIFSQGKPTYPAAPFDYAKQWRYTCAPDAEARLASGTWWAEQFATEHATTVTTQTTLAKKMLDYLRYAGYDKYFKPIAGYDGSGAHYLNSWYAAWGGEIPAPSTAGAWGFRIGSSEAHHGYNNVDSAYIACTDGENWGLASSGAAAWWRVSVVRQLEMIRWCQSPEGPIAGGVSYSWMGRYETPTDGRQSFKFYGGYYTYAPVWHDPPSNNWVGFQAWGLERVAALYLITSDKSGTFNNDLRYQTSIILDRYINWYLDNTSFVGDVFVFPITLSWTSPTQVVGQTTTTPNLEGTYEYLPTLNWDSTGDYGAFWNASVVPNPNLHCTIHESGADLGTAAAHCQMLIQYAEAKRREGGSLSDTIPGGAHTVQEALDLARDVMDFMWDEQRDARGFTGDEIRTDYNRFNENLQIPSIYSGKMHNGDSINSSSTFLSIRSFLTSDPQWYKVQAYLDGGDPPVFRYHRSWQQCDVMAAFAMMHRYFADIEYP